MGLWDKFKCESKKTLERAITKSYEAAKNKNFSVVERAGIYNKLLQDSDIRAASRIISQSPKNDTTWKMPTNMSILFNKCAQDIEPREVFAFTRATVNSDIAPLISSRKYHDSVSYASDALTILSRKCPEEEKRAFYALIDEPYFLSQMFNKPNYNDVLDIYINIFKDIEPNITKNILSRSTAWKTISNDPQITKQIEQSGESQKNRDMLIDNLL